MMRILMFIPLIFGAQVAYANDPIDFPLPALGFYQKVADCVRDGFGDSSPQFPPDTAAIFFNCYGMVERDCSAFYDSAFGPKERLRCVIAEVQIWQNLLEVTHYEIVIRMKQNHQDSTDYEASHAAWIESTDIYFSRVIEWGNQNFDKQYRANEYLGQSYALRYIYLEGFYGDD